jgi:hypothetical protein
MADVPLNVIITADSAAIRKALRGIQKEIAKTETVTQKEIEKTDQARTRSMRRQKSQVQQLGKEFRRLGSNVERELQKSIFNGTKRGIQRAGQYMRNNRGSIVKGLGAVGIAGAYAGRQAIQTARGITGAPTIQENIANAKQFEMRMALLQNQSRMTDAQMSALQAKIVSQAGQGTLSPLQLLGGIEAVQRLEGADALQDFLDSIGTATKFSEGLGANFEGLAKLTTVLSRQFHITQAEMDDMVGFMAEAGVQGSVELENFAGQFPRVMGIFTNLLGRRGVAGAREFTAVSQAVATGFPDAPEEASTALKALIATLANPRTIKILKTRGLDPQVHTIPQIGEALQKRPLAPDQMAKAFNRMALSAMVAVMSQYDPSNPKGNVITDVLAAQGSTQVGYAGGNVARIRGTSTGQDLIRANQMAGNMIGAFKDTADSALKLTAAFDELTSKFPKEILVAQTITQFLSSLSVLAIAMKFLGGGTAVKAGAKGLATGTKAVAGLGGGAVGAVAAGVALPAALALGTGALLAQMTDKEDEDAMERFARKLGFDPHNKLGTEIGRELKEGAAAQKRSAYLIESKLNAAPNTGQQVGD